MRKNFTNWTSGNEKINNFIQERQLEINNSQDSIFEWIPYNQFSVIKEVNKDDFATIYITNWKDGPLYYDNYEEKYIRGPYREVALKYSHNLQNVDEFLNEV